MSESQRGQIPLLLLIVVLVLVAAVVFIIQQGPGEENGEDAGTTTSEPREREPAEAAPLGEVDTGVGDRTEAPRIGATGGIRTDLFAEESGAGLVMGSVVDQVGAPVGGASVTLQERMNPAEVFAAAERGERPRSIEVRTSGEGRYVFEQLPPDMDFDMWVAHADYAPAPGVPVRTLPGENQEIQPVVLGQGYSVIGSVRDTGGNPLPATLEVWLQATTPQPQSNAEYVEQEERRLRKRVATEADQNGMFRLENLAEGMWTLRASYEGYASTQVHPVVLMGELEGGATPMEMRQDLVMDSEKLLGGRVTDDDGNVVPDAQIEISRSRPRPIMSFSSKSGPDGGFRVRGLSEGLYGISVTAPGYSRTTLPRVSADTMDLEIVLHKRASVSGQVFGPGGRPVQSFRLEAMSIASGTAVFGRTNRSLEFRDADGRYEFTDLEPGSYRLLAWAPGLAPTYSPGFYVERDPVQGVDIRLKEGGEIRGAVVAALGGSPLAGAEIVLHGKDYTEENSVSLFGGTAPDPNNVPPVSTRTDADGRFVLRNAYPGSIKVEFRHPKYLSEYLVIEVQEGAREDLGVMRMRLGGSIYGIATDEAGNPLAGGTAHLMKQTETGFGYFSKTERLDALGRFRFDGLRAGTYRISAASASGGGFLFLAEAEGSTQNVYVAEGSEEEVNLRVSNSG